MARDLGPHRIRVNTIVPGWIMTERQKELWATPEALSRAAQPPMPAGSDRPRLCCADCAVFRLGRRGDVHRQQLYGRGRLDLSDLTPTNVLPAQSPPYPVAMAVK